MLGAIKARFFSELEIPRLPIDRQRQIANVNALARKEIRLLRQLADEKESYYNLQINRIHEEMKRGN